MASAEEADAEEDVASTGGCGGGPVGGLGRLAVWEDLSVASAGGCGGGCIADVPSAEEADAEEDVASTGGCGGGPVGGLGRLAVSEDLSVASAGGGGGGRVSGLCFAMAVAMSEDVSVARAMWLASAGGSLLPRDLSPRPRAECARR